MDLADTKKQIKVLFFGRVQGVGFRYRVCRIAESMAVTGQVRNRSEGSVEVVAEGIEQELVDFLHRIQEAQIGRYITKEQVRWMPATGQYNKFGISFE